MFAREQNGVSLPEDFCPDLTSFICFCSAAPSQVHSTAQKPLTLAVEPLAYGVGIVDADAVHLAPGVSGRLKLRILGAHFLELAVEVVFKQCLDILSDEALA